MAVDPQTISTTERIRDALVHYEHRARKNTRCVVFVHGLAGHIHDTWRKDRTSKDSFPDLVLQDHELHDYDVVLIGYRTTYIRGAPIDNAARQLAIALAQPQLDQYSSLVLIGHSMGGLVCMQYIINELQRSVVPPITGLLLYGTPTTGSDLINVAKLVGYGIGIKIPLVRFAVNIFLRGQRQIVDLATGSEFLARLHTEWAYRVVNGGHEKAGAQRMWLPVRVVTGEDDMFVKEASGKGVYGATDWQPLKWGHVQLVKPEESNDYRYLAAKSFLQISRRVDPKILDRVWQASQDIWRFRSARVSERLDLTTVIHDTKDDTRVAVEKKLLQGFSRCETICAYDVILEKDQVEFGISIGDGDVWKRSFLPMYVHQIGLNLLKQEEKDALRSSVDDALANPDDLQVWSRFFSKVEISVDDKRLAEGDFIWPQSTRTLANWLLRTYKLPDAMREKVGSKARLKIDYVSIVPLALPHFTFSAPWIVSAATTRVVVFGKFEYFVSSYRLFPSGRAERNEDTMTTRREVSFSYDGIMLPGSSFEVRWRRARPLVGGSNQTTSGGSV